MSPDLVATMRRLLAKMPELFNPEQDLVVRQDGTVVMTPYAEGYARGYLSGFLEQWIRQEPFEAYRWLRRHCPNCVSGEVVH